jgi:hypothetical protein
VSDGKTMTLLDVFVPTYVQMLAALKAWLGKAEAQMPDGKADALLSAHLAPDMFPLSTQIRFACVQAQEGVYRLQERAFPDTIEILLNEGRNAAERPGSIADARARIEETLGVVNAVAAERVLLWRHSQPRASDAPTIIPVPMHTS